MKNTALKGYRYPYALVGFGGKPRFWWMKYLKKGFYHCFVALGNGREWILIDPLVHYTDTLILKNVNIHGFLKSQGYRIIQTTPEVPDNLRLHLMPYTCVETVKRFLGIKKNKYFYTLSTFLLFNE